MRSRDRYGEGRRVHDKTERYKTEQGRKEQGRARQDRTGQERTVELGQDKRGEKGSKRVWRKKETARQ